MALVLADRVKETTTSTGTTAITLAGALTGYQTFSSAVGNANTTYYTIADQSGANWEVGIGTYTSAGNTLSRDTVLASSNAGALVIFTSGTKDVFVTYPAEVALYSGGALGTPSSGTLTNCTFPVASTSVSGTVKVDGTTITISGGVISSTGGYTLPTASTSVLGGVKVDGTTITINGSGVISSSGGSGTVTTTSVVTANGFAGTVSNPTTTPAITLTTSVSGMLKGSASALVAATSGTDFSAGTATLATGILKSTTTTGALSIAVAADFPTLNQNTTGTSANVTGIVAVANGGTGVTTSTGTGDNVLSSSPTLVNPTLGTPASGNLSNCNALPLSTGVSGILSASNGGTGYSSFSNAASAANLAATNVTNNFTAKQQIQGSFYIEKPSNTSIRISDRTIATTGIDNVTLGFQLAEITTGESNVIIGRGAGSGMATQSYNTVVGVKCLDVFANGASVVGQTGNTAIGQQVAQFFLYNNSSATAGYNNTWVGKEAGGAFKSYLNSSMLGYKAEVSGDNQVQLGNSSTTTYVYGTVQNRSDIRDKADVRDTVLGLDFLMKLRPVDYKWDMRDDYYDEVMPPTMPEMADEMSYSEKQRLLEEFNLKVKEYQTLAKLQTIEKDGSKKRNRFHHGFIAQEVKAIIDETGIDFGGYQDHNFIDGKDVLTIGYDEFVSVLVKSVQELKATVDDLKAKVNAQSAPSA